VLDPLAETENELDVVIVDGIVAELARNLKYDGAEVIEAAGMLVAPGLIDMHVHLREPGYEAKETIETGLRAAARGGFTGVACMPNTNPVADNQTVINYIAGRAASLGLARVWPIGAITRGSKGESLAEMAELKEAGAVAFSDDGQPVAGAGIMRRAMQYARMVGLTIIAHCEEPSLAAGGSMNEGFMSTKLGLKGIPGAAEEVMVARDIILSEFTGCPLHIAHVSTAGSVRLVREAKARGLKVTAEAAPHHFTLTDEAVEGYSTSTKVNPPLRGEADVAAVRQGLADGTIDVIATDHAPHTSEEKEVEYDRAPFGMVGLETAVGLVWSELVASGLLTPARAVAKMTVNPARILGIAKDTVRPGAVADITIINPQMEEAVNPYKFASKGRNTPFAGRKLKGLPVLTMVGGKVIYSRL
jgi:dihydroorotase